MPTDHEPYYSQIQKIDDAEENGKRSQVWIHNNRTEMIDSPKILYLTVKRKWFDMIASGVKKEEYRSDVPWIRSRLLTSNGTRKHYDFIQFTNGYRKDSPKVVLKYDGFDFGIPNPEWSNGGNEIVFRIKLGEIKSFEI